MFKTCLENRIIRHEGDYKCYICHCEIRQSFDLVEEHLLTEKHKERLNQLHEKQRKSESDALVEFSESQLRIVVENRITFDRFSILFYCHVCKSMIGDLCNALVHVRDISHRLALKEFETNQKVNTNKTLGNKVTAIPKSKSSNSQVPISDVQSQVNRISFDKKSNSYYCNICKSNITENKSELLHQALELELTNQDSCLDLDRVIYDKTCNLYHCTICMCQIYGSAQNVLEHIEGYLHQTRLRIQSSLEMKGIEVASQEFASQVIFEAQKVLEAEDIESSIQKSLLEESSLESCFSVISCCDPCQAFLENHTEAQHHVMLHLYKEFKLLNNFDVLEFKIGSDENSYLKCLLCDFYCVSGMSNSHKFLRVHFETEKHLERLKFFKLTKNDLTLEDDTEKINSLDLEKFTYSTDDSISPGLLCNFCNIPVPCTSEHPSQHILGKNHKKKSKIENGLIENQAEFDAKKDHNHYMCFMCDESFNDTSVLLEHYKTTEHKCKIESFKTIKKCSYTNFQKFNKTEIIRCSLCNILLYDSKSTMEHISGKIHNEKLTLMSVNQDKKEAIALATSLAELAHEIKHLNINANKKSTKKQKKNAASVRNKTSNITTENLKKTKKANKLESNIITRTFQPLSGLEPDKVVNALDNLLPLDFSDKEVRRLPTLAIAKLPRTPKGDSKKHLFATNVLLNGKQYIRFCIDSGPENIYNFDHEKISLLKTGVSLTAPHGSERVCFPCGQQLPNELQSLFEHLQKQEHIKSLFGMQVEDKCFENCPEQFSHLRLAQLYMHVANQVIQCHACNIEVGDDDEIIRQHAEELAHKEKTFLWKQQSEQLFNQFLTIYKDIWYYAEVFFCEICKKKYDFEIDFIKHLIHPDHMKKVNDLKFKGVALTFDLCPSCITYWFGNTNSYEIHCKSNFHKRFAKNKDFMVPELTVNASEFLDNIDDNIAFLESESNKVNLERDNEILLLNAIEETVKPKYSNAKAYTFGSRLSHLGFLSSDVDVFLDCENVYYTSSTKEQSQQYIKSVKMYFEKASKVWVVDEVLLTSRVPIMKLRHLPTNLKCDISFINGLSVEKSKLVGLYNVAFPICRKLILFMKKWLTLCRLFGSNCITTFAISWCAIFYLQLQGILPTVYELIKNNDKTKIIDGWQCGFVETFAAKDSNLSFKEHLKGFFTYFANFDYQTSVICPYLGKTINKHAFAYTDKLSIEMDIYKNRLKNNDVEIFRFDSPMCIQDPIDLSQNMTKAVKKQQLRCFRQYCILSAKKC